MSGTTSRVPYRVGWRAIASIVVLTVVVSPAMAAVHTFYPVQDALIDQVYPDNNWGSLYLLLVRNSDDGMSTVWEDDALVAFDLSSVPSGATVASARLYLYYFNWSDTNPVGRVLTCYSVTGAWAESTVTWNTRPTIAPSATSQDTVPASYSWMSWDVTADVQNIVDGLAANHGWQVMDEVPWGSSSIPMIRFYSKEYGSYSPYLEVELDEIPLDIGYIAGVPDVNQPPDETLGTAVTNYCAPIAAVNITQYWDSVMVHPNAVGVNAGLPAVSAAKYIGYFMGTNGEGSAARMNTPPSAVPGTCVADQDTGFAEFVLWDAGHTFLTPPPALPQSKRGYSWKFEFENYYTLTASEAFEFCANHIDQGFPVKIDFLFWNPVATGGTLIEPTSGDTVTFFSWGEVVSGSSDPLHEEEWNLIEGETGIGHAVTGVGYLRDYDPDGAGILPSDNYIVVHDNWPDTPTNVALPWAYWNAVVSVDPRREGIPCLRALEWSDPVTVWTPQPIDTHYYGGTVWDALDGQWEAATPGAAGWANRKMWTWASSGFHGVPHSGLSMDGWSGVDYSGVCADYARAEFLTDLDPNLVADPCVVAVPPMCEMDDSVLVMFDAGTPSYPHPACQDNFVQSPAIDLSATPGWSGRMLSVETLAGLPPEDHVFIYWMVRHKPSLTADWSWWLSDNCAYHTEPRVSCLRWETNVSTYVPPSAAYVQVALGVINLCDEAPFGFVCTNSCNATPYFDNVAFGVFGPRFNPHGVPYIGVQEHEYWQDQFAEDGTLNPQSTADTRTSMNCGNLTPPIFGDTLTCSGIADNMEVHFVFRIPNLGFSQPFAHPFFTIWFPNVQLGGWFSARMDTAEAIGLTSAATGKWMCAFHESDPVAVANALPEGTEILPNNLFVPGTRVEYFLKACYVGSADTFYLPAAGQSDPEEFEILPMFVDDGTGSVEWPCLIYVDHFGQRGNGGTRNSARTSAALAAAGYEFDMYNRLGPSSDLRNGIGRLAANPGQIGGPGIPKYNWGPGATIHQMLAYSHCMLNCGSVDEHGIYEADADMLRSWLTVYTDEDHFRFLWLSGDSWARELARRTPWGPLFLNTTLATTYVGNSYAVTANDFTYCLQVNSVAGGAIVSAAEPYTVRMNGCPRNYNFINAATGGVLEEEYDAQVVKKYAAVSNAQTYYRTFTEGYDWTVMRDGTAGFPTCGVDPLATWFTSVLTWGALTNQTCGPSFVIDVKEPGVVPAVVTSLGQAFPNPMNPTATINYSIGTPGKVQLRVFDVSGRVIRTLVDETMTAGAYKAIWDGKNDGGERVASGVFFYQLEMGGCRSAKKIMVLE